MFLTFIPVIFQFITGLFSSGSSTVAAAIPGASSLKLGLVAVVVLALAGGGAYLYWDISSLNSTLALAQAQNATLTLEVSQAQQAVNQCTVDTEKLKSDSDAWSVRAQAAEAAAVQQAQPDFQQAATILAAKPAAGSSDAAAADALLNSLIPTKGK